MSTYYEIRVKERLTPRTAAWFEGMTVALDEDTTPAQSVIRGFVHDQAALYGLIGRARDLGLSLISIQSEAMPNE